MTGHLSMRALLFLPAAFALWLGLIGRAGLPDLIQGALVVSSAWWLYLRASGHPPAGPDAAWIGRAVRFMILHVGPDMIRSTTRVVGKVLNRRVEVHPAILQVPLPEASEADLILFAYSIALTPGQQIVRIEEHARTLYVHVTDAPDPDAERAAILAIYDRYFRRA